MPVEPEEAEPSEDSAESEPDPAAEPSDDEEPLSEREPWALEPEPLPDAEPSLLAAPAEEPLAELPVGLDDLDEPDEEPDDGDS